MKQARFYVAKMDCPTEERLIRKRFESLEGVGELQVNLMTREILVQHELDSDQAIQSALEALGMEPRRLDGDVTESRAAEAVSSGMRDPKTGAGETPSSRWGYVLLGVSGASAVAAEIVAWTTGNEKAPVVIALAVLSMVMGGRETLIKGLRAVRLLTLNINFLMTVAIVGAVAIGQWPEAAMVTFLFAVAEAIEAHSLDRARNAIRSLMEMSPETATVRKDGRWIEVEAASVEVGQVVRVRPGERIPLDGKVTNGSSTVNQAPITGESMPVRKEPGDTVFAGSVNELGSIEFEVTANKGNTTLARIVRSVQEAQSVRAPTQRFVDAFSRYYTPSVVVLAILVAAVPPLALGAAFYPWLYKALVLLVIACPCALVISTPVTVVSGLAAAAKRGILVKGGVYLEGARKLKAVALDKTGTVTHGKPVVTDVVPLNGRSADEVLELAAAVDAPSEHPVARAIVMKWTGEGGRREIAATTEFASITGRGAQARVDGRLYYVGSHKLAESRGACSAAVEAELERLEGEGKTTVVITTEEEPLGVIGVADTPRETSIEAIKRLHALGLTTVMLTGDNQKTGQAIAKVVGIDDVRGDLMPDDKVTAIASLLDQYGAVGMVGDGINDAPALAKASIGFAMGAAGTDTALETADVALMQDDLRKLPDFIELSKRTAAVLTQNIAFAIGIKAVFFVLALAGVATLWMAVFADLGASLLVVFNGLRLLREPPSSATLEKEAAVAHTNGRDPETRDRHAHDRGGGAK